MLGKTHHLAGPSFQESFLFWQPEIMRIMASCWIETGEPLSRSPLGGCFQILSVLVAVRGCKRREEESEAHGVGAGLYPLD